MTDELISDGYNLDLKDGISIPLNMSIADVTNPSNRKRTFSKEVELPDTMNNNAFFSGAFSFTTTDNGVNFNATAKAPIILLKSGIQVLTGTLQLINVTVLDTVVTYNCRVLSDTVDIFLLLASKGINELDWSAYDHTLTRPNIKASWVATAGTGYYYPLIERGKGRLGNLIFRTTDLIPYVYFREVLQKVFEWAGITWDSDFLDTNQFKNILFGYGGGDILSLNATDLNNRKVEIDAGEFVFSPTSWLNNVPYGLNINDLTIVRNVNYIMGLSNISPFDDDYFTRTITQDILGQFDDGAIYINKTGNYNLNIAMSLDYTFGLGTMTNAKWQGYGIGVYNNGVFQYTISSTQGIQVGASGTFTLDTNTSVNLYCYCGDIITFKLLLSNVSLTLPIGIAFQTLTFDLTTNTPITIDFTSIDTVITDGGVVTLGNYLPKMKCSEFLIGAIRQFNLYVSDPDVDGVVKVEPLTDYYLPTNQFTDITTLIDNKKVIDIKSTGNEYAKKTIFKFKECTDYEATTYFNKWASRYNDYDLTQGSYYAQGDQTIEVPWSTIIPYQIAPGILIPRFVKIENNVMKPNAGAPRIMFRNGQKNGTFVLRNASNSLSETLTTYPCVHHFDNWNNPTMDLSFQLTNEVFYTATVVTMVNCYSEYYFEFVNELVNSSGKIVTLYIKWNSKDVRDLNWAKLLMINGALFRLNAIKDFAPDEVLTTKIELIKVLKAKKQRRVQITQLPLAKGGKTATSPTGVGEDVGVITGGFSATSLNSKVIRG